MSPPESAATTALVSFSFAFLPSSHGCEAARPRRHSRRQRPLLSLHASPRACNFGTFEVLSLLSNANVDVDLRSISHLVLLLLLHVRLVRFPSFSSLDSSIRFLFATRIESHRNEREMEQHRERRKKAAENARRHDANERHGWILRMPWTSTKRMHLCWVRLDRIDGREDEKGRDRVDGRTRGAIGKWSMKLERTRCSLPRWRKRRGERGWRKKVRRWRRGKGRNDGIERRKGSDRNDPVHMDGSNGWESHRNCSKDERHRSTAQPSDRCNDGIAKRTMLKSRRWTCRCVALWKTRWGGNIHL